MRENFYFLYNYFEIDSPFIFYLLPYGIKKRHAVSENGRQPLQSWTFGIQVSIIVEMTRQVKNSRKVSYLVVCSTEQSTYDEKEMVNGDHGG